jgi:hypothetical protein
VQGACCDGARFSRTGTAQRGHLFVAALLWQCSAQQFVRQELLMQESVWGALSRSSKQAARWAAAAARRRCDREGRPLADALVDEFDLLVGIMLAHPSDSEPWQLLAHVGASAADVLPAEYPVPGPDLERYAAHVADGLSPSTPAVEQAFDTAVQLAYGAKFVELKAVFGGLLAGSNLVAAAFRELLSGVGLSGAADGYRDYLASSNAETYAEYLARVHPFRATPIEVPDYKADKGEKGVPRDDLVDIRAEVDAFAYLLASKSLRPPLAVGLFGDWGSGKTFFMDAVKSRIAELVRSREARETPQMTLPFWKQVVQIDFNAWHYVEGDLWASLVEHVFSQLRVTGDRDDTAVARRQKHWLAQIEAKRTERIEVMDRISAKRAEQEVAKTGLKAARKRKEREERKLESAQRRAREELVLQTSRRAAQRALVGLVDEPTDGAAGQTLQALGHARTQLERGSGALAAYPWDRRKSAFLLAALLCVPLLVFVLDQVDAIPATAQVFAGVSAGLALVARGLRSVSTWTKAQLDELDRAESAVRAEIEEKRRRLERELREAEAKVSREAEAVEELAAHDRQLENEIAELEVRAKAVTSGEILGEFLAERVGSDDYRKRLGTAALIQRDFDELSKLIDEQNGEFIRTDDGKKPPPPQMINRIILYIDDLDRCEPQRVIEVLQAVHLLLAFPLFVVVVAVDSRWLAHSLAEHYPALATSVRSVTQPGLNGADGDHATPSDYLEKIFQVPFWIEPLGSGARKALVRGLLQGNLATTAGHDQTASGAEPLELGADARGMVAEMFGRARAVRLQTAALTVTPAELTFLDGLSPLLGDTPRSIKRFVNVYQLLCALPVPPGVGSPAYEQSVAFLLAIADGLPTLYGLLGRALEQNVDKTVGAVVTASRRQLAADEWARWDAWAKEHQAFVTEPLQRLAVPAQRVRRFTFADEPSALAAAAGD